MDISAERIAIEYYPENTYEHCKRVVKLLRPEAANIIKATIPANCGRDSISAIWQDLQDTALLHDIYEDTDFKMILEGSVHEAVKILTRDIKDTETYAEYVSRIVNHRTKSYAGALAYWVKIADMKDHLTQTATLTPKLKEKYLKGLAILL